MVGEKRRLLRFPFLSMLMRRDDRRAGVDGTMILGLGREDGNGEDNVAVDELGT